MPAYTVARIAGIPVRVHPSLALTCLAVAYLLVRVSASFGVPPLSAASVSLALAGMLLYCGSVLLHELGHLTALRRFGLPVDRVLLNAWGGTTRALAQAQEPAADFAVAAAGPACSLLLCIAGLSAWFVFGGSGGGCLRTLAAVLACLNLMTLLPSVVPVWPADGGYMLRAVAWRLSGSRQVATRFACYQSVALIGLLLVTGAASLVLPFLPGGKATGAVLLVAGIACSPNARGILATLRRIAPGQTVSGSRVRITSP